MKLLISLFMTLTVLFAMSAQADIASDKQNVNTACVQEAVTANCGDKSVGSGLLKCLHAYKKANRSFNYSDACKNAMGILKEDIKVNGHKKKHN